MSITPRKASSQNNFFPKPLPSVWTKELVDLLHQTYHLNESKNDAKEQDYQFDVYSHMYAEEVLIAICRRPNVDEMRPAASIFFSIDLPENNSYKASDLDQALQFTVNKTGEFFDLYFQEYNQAENDDDSTLWQDSWELIEADEQGSSLLNIYCRTSRENLYLTYLADQLLKQLDND